MFGPDSDFHWFRMSYNFWKKTHQKLPQCIVHHARKNNQALESEWHDVRVLGLAMFSPTPRSRAIKLQTWLEKLNTRKILINFCLFANYWSFKSIVWYCKHLIDVTILVLSSAQNKKLLLPFTFYLLRNQINANKIFVFRANYLTKLSDQSNFYQCVSKDLW